jgi:hypothetical protein
MPMMCRGAARHLARLHSSAARFALFTDRAHGVRDRGCMAESSLKIFMQALKCVEILPITFARIEVPYESVKIQAREIDHAFLA